MVLKKELDLPIIEMSDAKARLDGGDVLFTGKYLMRGSFVIENKTVNLKMLQIRFQVVNFSWEYRNGPMKLVLRQ